MSISSVASRERVMRRDREEWSMSTIPTGTFSGNPSFMRLRKKNVHPNGTTTIMKK